ncbi:hypothetical protein PoB_003772800 [Plakobranchus ocellatus]|uniref:Uncharacterized protein n=1 Tax=Plakobranchus ocellatus TaxID=259542 RepID=A0AAV4AWK4_9GAST|nr:hypothetical protein PoB_003772800 [Plakobranchus ocellatus]
MHLVVITDDTPGLLDHVISRHSRYTRSGRARPRSWMHKGHGVRSDQFNFIHPISARDKSRKGTRTDEYGRLRLRRRRWRWRMRMMRECEEEEEEECAVYEASVRG